LYDVSLNPEGKWRLLKGLLWFIRSRFSRHPPHLPLCRRRRFIGKFAHTRHLAAVLSITDML
jgi:hypothetical protein